MLGQVGDYHFNKTTHNNLKARVDVAGTVSEKGPADTESQHLSQSSRLHQSYEARYKDFAQLMDQHVALSEIAKKLDLSEITLHSQRYLQRYTKHN